MRNKVGQAEIHFRLYMAVKKREREIPVWRPFVFLSPLLVWSVFNCYLMGRYGYV